ncbi:MAG TPA: NAD(P)H-dependent glycerol-3-phosphate dehydrogenase [Gemmatimonadaceae bacterium]|nr:NAD(P)H-dependent glycerol-3-phosphate dehydrogenase [Gemmatimonadaceae bacterium]
MKITVIGAGAWGTALANLLAENGHETLLWAYEPDVVDSVNTQSENRRFLTGVPLHQSLRATPSLQTACAAAELIIYASPSHVLREVANQAARWVPPAVPLVVATKGIERGPLSLMTDVVAEETPGRPVVALSGPTFALEVASHLPTAIVAASKDADAARLTQQTLSTSAFRVYTQTDVTGVELGGALKNVMAVATGISDGLQLGFNARAALITRGLAEMTRLGVKLGADAATFAGLAGIGDLVLTCTGSLSRNRSVGIEIGRGATLSEVLQGRDTVAEGVTTTESARALAELHGIDMPIVRAVHRVLFERQPARWALVELMTRDLREEND